MNGLQVVGDTLMWNGVALATDTQKIEGLHVKPPRDLYFNRQRITAGDLNNQKGLYSNGTDLFFDGIRLGGDSGVNPNEFTPKGYWIAPQQDSGFDMKAWTYAQWIAAYDALVAVEPKLTKHRYEDENGQPIVNPAAGSYELYHYKFEPENYTKTIFMQAQIHGNERDSRLTLYRMIEILINKRGRFGYTAWQDIYNNCRLIIIPVVSPWGNDNNNARTPYKDDLVVNANRTYDFNHSPANESGSGGDVPFDIAESQHSRDVILKYGAENIDYAIDYHDGAGVQEHYWIGFNVDAPNRVPILEFVDEMLARRGISKADAQLQHMKDTSTNGAAGNWLAKSMGITSSVNEWLGAFFGADFGSEHLTHSLEVRSNLLFLTLQNDFKAWQVNEPANARYFHFDFPKAFTRKSLQQDGAYPSLYVTETQIMQRWDALTALHPSAITKSNSFGLNEVGTSVHTYTFGTGSKKVLFLGGAMRTGVDNRIDEFAAYLLVEYLCNDYIVNQSVFLQDLRDNYTIVVLPFVSTKQGINSADNNNRAIAKSVINAHADAKFVFAGGEVSESYTANYQTQFIQPLGQNLNLADYITHLTAERGELTSVTVTDGQTILDYAYTAHGMNGLYVNLKVSNRYAELSDYHTLSVEQYLHSNYEAGRRMANIANLFLM